MKFTDRKLLGLKPRESRYEVREQDGFVMQIYPSGKKVFQFVYSAHKKKHRVTIGEYPTVFTLAEAREKHAEFYRAAKRGESPRAIANKNLTVGELGAKFLRDYVSKTNTPRTLHNRTLQFENDVYPHIGDKRAADVSRADVALCLTRLSNAGAATGHNHLLGSIKKMYNWAIERELVENNPAHLIKTMSTTPRDKLLSDDDISMIMSTADRDSAKILQLCLLTACRPGEAKRLKHEDIIDGWWICEQRKGGKISKKRTPLSISAKELIGTGMSYSH